ncbi:MAG: protease complex subunit PrcB family protein [Gammaproteobacteria bacterium]
MKNTTAIVLGTAFVAVAGCTSSGAYGGGNKTLAATQLYSGSQCATRGADTKAVWVTSAQRLDQYYDQIHGGKLGIQPEPLPEIDFDKEGVLMIEMGRRSSGGYGVSVGQKGAYLVGGDAVVHVDWAEPAEGTMQTQALTAPCVMVKLRYAGYGRIRVVDQNEQERLTVPVPK